jgi:hypothetical protein
MQICILVSISCKLDGGLWRYFDYLTVDGENLMEQWYNAQAPAVQAAFDTRLLLLRGLNNWEECSDWRNPPFKRLTGAHAGLGEIRFHIEEPHPVSRRRHRVRFRPVGMWPVETAHEFVLILGCKKVRKTYTPHDAFACALRHLADLKSGKGGKVEREL